MDRKVRQLNFLQGCPVKGMLHCDISWRPLTDLCAPCAQKPVASDLFPVVRHTVNGDLGLGRGSKPSSEGRDDDFVLVFVPSFCEPSFCDLGGEGAQLS